MINTNVDPSPMNLHAWIYTVTQLAILLIDCYYHVFNHWSIKRYCVKHNGIHILSVKMHTFYILSRICLVFISPYKPTKICGRCNKMSSPWWITLSHTECRNMATCETIPLFLLYSFQWPDVETIWSTGWLEGLQTWCNPVKSYWEMRTFMGGVGS